MPTKFKLVYIIYGNKLTLFRKYKNKIENENKINFESLNPFGIFWFTNFLCINKVYSGFQKILLSVMLIAISTTTQI